MSDIFPNSCEGPQFVAPGPFHGLPLADHLPSFRGKGVGPRKARTPARSTDEPLLREFPKGWVDRRGTWGPLTIRSPGHLADQREPCLGSFSEKPKEEWTKEPGGEEPHPERTAPTTRGTPFVDHPGRVPSSVLLSGAFLEDSLYPLGFGP